jgi:hypothetical protein
VLRAAYAAWQSEMQLTATSADELVTKTVNRKYVFRLVRVPLNFLSQPGNMNVYRSRE